MLKAVLSNVTTVLVSESIVRAAIVPLCWGQPPDKRRIRKLAQNPFSEGLAFRFAFQIESSPIAAGALGCRLGGSLEYNLAHPPMRRFRNSSSFPTFISAHIGLVPEFFKLGTFGGFLSPQLSSILHIAIGDATHQARSL